MDMNVTVVTIVGVVHNYVMVVLVWIRLRHPTSFRTFEHRTSLVFRSLTVHSYEVKMQVDKNLRLSSKQES